MANATLTTDLINIEYLTGFKSSNAFMIHVGKKHYLFTDGRYLEKAQTIADKGKGRIGGFKVRDMGKNRKEEWQKLMKRHRISRMSYDEDHLTVRQFKQFKSMQKGLKWTIGEKKIEIQRAQKDSEEIKKLKQAQALNEQVFYSARKGLTVGITEIEVAKQIKQFALNAGADDISFEPIVGFGNHSSMPHHQNTSRKLKKGDLILIDMGVSYEGYASDMTRMIFTQSPTPHQEKIYNLVLAAQKAAIQSMKPRVRCSRLDKIARDILKKEGYEDKFTHSLGHGIGLEVHEAPNLSGRSPHVLKKGMVVTSEPGIYLSGDFGVRIEDMILITDSGHQNLTKVPKSIKDCILR